MRFFLQWYCEKKVFKTENLSWDILMSVIRVTVDLKYGFQVHVKYRSPFIKYIHCMTTSSNVSF